MVLKVSATQIVNYFFPLKQPKWALALKEGTKAEELAREKNEWLKELKYQYRIEKLMSIRNTDVLVVGVIDFLDEGTKTIFDTKLHRPIKGKAKENLMNRYRLQLSIYRFLLGDPEYKTKIIEIDEEGDVVDEIDVEPLSFDEIKKYIDIYVSIRLMLGW